MLKINILLASLLSGLLITTPLIAANTVTSTDNDFAGAPNGLGPNASFPMINTASNHPNTTRFCCTIFLDYMRTIIVSNQQFGYISNNMVDLPVPPAATKRLSAAPSGLGGLYGNLFNVTYKDGHNARNQDGQWMSCPAGFIMTGKQYLHRDDNSGSDTADTIFCTPLQQYCQWLLYNSATTGTVGTNYTQASEHYVMVRSGGTDRPGINAGSDVRNFNDYNPSTPGLYTTCR